MSAYPTPLTPATIQTAMQALTAYALGLIPSPSTAIPAAAAATVRIGWQRRGQPMPGVDDEVVFVRCDLVDVPAVNRVRNRTLLPDPQDANVPPQTLINLTTYTRVWRTYWEFYGPQQGFDRARQMHSAFYGQQVHDTFAALGLELYWVPDSEMPQRVPLEYPPDSGQWFEVTYFTARFNESVQEPLVVPVMKSVEVKIYENTAGQIADFTVPLA